MPLETSPSLRDVVLVGAGHSHVQTLRHFAMRPPARTRLTVVVDTPIAVYSGMVPGFIAGQYRADELEIDAVPLARRAGARVVFSAALGLDPLRREIHFADRPPLPYDLASFDVGSTVAGLDLPGVKEHALATRPIGRFVARIDQAGFDRPLDGPLIVVGGGAGGVELVFALEQRMRAAGHRPPEILLLHGGRQILPGYAPSVIERVLRRAEERGIEVRCGCRVSAIEPDVVVLEGGEQLPQGLVVWVTGAVSKPLFRSSGLETDGRGFLQTRSTLQSLGHDDLFGVGDCATLVDHPETPKAGVYAVRQGPALTANLKALLVGDAPTAYRPQRDFLTLMNLGDGSAIGTKWSRAVEGPAMMRLKDWIDRRFMEKFQVLDLNGASKPAFSQGMTMADGDEMLCGGCAAKLGQSALERVLERLDPEGDDPQLILGRGAGDDAVVHRSRSGDILATSIDAFRAFTDDPFVVGRVAAHNALSDLLAKGVTPRIALALVQLDEEEVDAKREETLFQVLSGAQAALGSEQTTLAGGHTIVGPDLTVGFSVEGELESPTQAATPDASGRPPGPTLLAIDRAQVGQHLVLSRGLGSGVLFFADMRAAARGPWIEAAIETLSTSQGRSVRLAIEAGATAATDITGFGLAGHLGELVRASQVRAEVWLESVPALAGALELLSLGHRSTYHPTNLQKARALGVGPEHEDDPRLQLLSDPQTAGPLLFCVPAEASTGLVAKLRDAGFPTASTIGQLLPNENPGATLITIRTSANAPSPPKLV